jgi:polar amino acid transport system permease protein
MARDLRYDSRFAYYMWVGVFFLLLGGSIFLLYTATEKIDYMWRWYNVPKYFINKEASDITAAIGGTVKSLTVRADEVIIQVEGEGESETYTVPGEDVRVSKGDFVYPGDTLATYEHTQAGILLQGLWVTLKVSLYSIFFGILLGLIGGISRMSKNPALKWSAITYVELIRGSPLLVQIFIWYFVLATMINSILLKYGIPEIPALWYGVAALSFFTGAYVTEIVRAGIQSIHRGQIEAARSLGMTGAQSMKHIILPQAMRRILPPLAGQFISLIKDSSLLGIIAIRELTKATREGITTSLQPYEFWFVCAGLYLLLTFTLSMFVQYLERRMAIQ